MTRSHKHLGSHAGTSFTKACACTLAAMRPVVIRQWNQAGAGFEA